MVKFSPNAGRILVVFSFILTSFHLSCKHQDFYMIDIRVTSMYLRFKKIDKVDNLKAQALLVFG